MKNNLFFSRCNRPVTIPVPQGNGERDLYEERVVDGVRQLVVTGKEDLKSIIEASKEETLISNIMKRFEMGDVNALSRVQGFYGDITGMPDNLAEAQNMLIKMENDFNSLPVDIKKKFDNSFDKYVKDVSSATVEQFKDMFNLNPIKETVKESEVVVDDKE